MEVSLLDTLTVVSLRVGETEQALLHEVTADVSADIMQLIDVPTPSRSRRQRPCVEDRGYRKLQQYRLHPI